MGELARRASLRTTTELAARRDLALDAPLRALFPEGLAQSATCALHGPGATSLALGLLAAFLPSGSWAVAIACNGLGLEAAAEVGVDLERLALVAATSATWAQATAVALEGFEVVLCAPPSAPSLATARRLAAHVRERQALLVLLDPQPGARLLRWPEPPDLSLTVTRATWSGLANGPGRLAAREVVVTRSGRRARGVSTAELFLPGPSGRLETTTTTPAEPERVEIARAG